MPARSHAHIVERPPGHARVLGAPRSGKTSLLVERFHHLTRAGYQPLVIAFGRDQRDRLLERLIPSGTARFGAMPVTTHGLLATRLISAARPNRARTLRDVDERIVLDRVLASEDGLLRSDLRSIAGSATLRDALLGVLHVLAQNGVTADQAEAATKRTKDARARDILRLFAAYQHHLGQHHLVTFYDAAWEAARAVGGDRLLLEAAGVRDVVLVDDFQDLDAGQFELLRAIAPPDGPIALEVFGDPTGSRFSFRGTSERFLTDEFPAAYRPAEFELPAPRPLDAALAECISLLALSQRPAPSIPTDRASSSTSSLPLFAGAQPVETTASEWNVRVHAVRAGDEVAEAQHAARCVRAWIEQGIAPGEIVVVARDPERVASLVHHAFRERGVPIDAGSRADSAVDAFVHTLVGALGRDGDGRFAEALESSPLMRSFCAERDLPGDAARAVSSLRAAYSARGGVDLERLLADAAAPLGNAGAIARVAQEWNRYAEVVAHAGGHPSLDEFRHAYLDAAPGESSGGNAPQLVSARAASGHSARAAVVLGCAEGLFPRVEIETGYLPLAALSSALAKVHPGASRDLAARVDRDHAEREEMALLLSALVCAREELFVSHPRKSGDQALTVPPALSPLFEQATEVTRDTPAGYRAAAKVACAASGESLADAAREVDWMAGGWIRPPAAPRRPVFEELALSPSRLQAFTDCERKFFYRRILRVEEPGSIYLDIGSVFHETLKELIPVGAGSAEVRAALQSDAEDIIDRAISEVMPDAGGWLRTLTQVHMRRMLDGVRALEERRDGEYRVLSVETAASYPSGEDAVLTGRLDRIDDVEGLGPVVVDYKTSKSLSKTAASIVEEIEEKREHWQVSVYSALAGALGHSAKGFLYYVVPPGEKVNAVGVQFSGGALRELIRAEGREQPRYGHLPAATLQAVLDDAMKIHADILSGACAYARTDDPDHCKNCHFIRVCRRTCE